MSELSQYRNCGSHYEVELEPGSIMKFDASDLQVFKSTNWKVRDGYARGYHDKKMCLFHRLICITDDSVDHINRDRLDNRRCNLRPASAREQNINRVLCAEKIYPPGITRQQDYFLRVFTDDTNTECKLININQFGEGKAIVMAMNLRLDVILGSRDFMKTLLPEQTLRAFFDKQGWKFESSEKAIEALKSTRVLFWKVLYDGKYESLVNKSLQAVLINDEASELFISEREMMTEIGTRGDTVGDNVVKALSEWRKAHLEADIKLSKTLGVKYILPTWSEGVEGMERRQTEDIEKRKKLEQYTKKVEEQVMTKVGEDETKCEKMMASLISRVGKVGEEKKEKKKVTYEDDTTDSVGKWMEERCLKKGRVGTAEAYADYVKWCGEGKERVKHKSTKFAYYLEKKGIEKEMRMTYSGVQIK
jgi:hypothetical protein